MDKIVGLKELRNRLDFYANEVKKGRSLIVVKRSKPLFKVSPLDEVEQWEEVADFTKIRRGGVKAKDLLSRL